MQRAMGCVLRQDRLQRSSAPVCRTLLRTLLPFTPRKPRRNVRSCKPVGTSPPVREPTQINPQIPFGLAPGATVLVVAFDGGRSAPFQFNVVRAAPGIFQDSRYHAVAQNSGDGYSLNSSSSPAAAGSVVVVFLTGQGQVDNRVCDGCTTPNSTLSKALAPAAATVGGKNATIQFLGLTPGFVGLGQANVQVPQDLGNGEYPLTITIGGYGSASALLSVSGQGTAAPTILSLVGQSTFYNAAFSSVAVFGDVAYICGTSLINIIDANDVGQSPLRGGLWCTGSSWSRWSMCGEHCHESPILVNFVGPGTPSSFLVFDLSNPLSPVTRGQITAHTYLTNLSCVGLLGSPARVGTNSTAP